MANDLPVGTSVEATDAYGMILRDLEISGLVFKITANYNLGQKLAGFVTKAPAENNNKYQVQVRQKWDFLPEVRTSQTDLLLRIELTAII